MKCIFLFIGILGAFIPCFSMAQNIEGVIVYEKRVNMHKRLTGEREAMRAMVPEFRTTYHQLFFNRSATYYKSLAEDKDEDMVGGGGGVRIRMHQPPDEIYTDKEKRISITSTEFMGRNFLIQDIINIQEWKIDEGDIREILGYPCKIAFYDDTVKNMEITAWYTTELPFFMGPEAYNNLPGAVLAVDINNGESVILATSVSLRNLNKNEIKMPVRGKKIIRSEYEQLVEEQMKRVRQEGGTMIRH